MLNCLNFANQDKSKTLYVYIDTSLLHLVDPSGYPPTVNLWNPLNLSPFLRPTDIPVHNSIASCLCVGDIDPHKTEIDKLVDVLHDYV